MIRNFILVAFRSLVKQKVYSAINILGFATSISACILILLYAHHEVTYDKFYSKADRIYKMAVERIYPDHRTFFATVPHSFGDVMKKDFPEVERTLQVNASRTPILVSYQSSATEIKSFEEDHFIMADSTFFKFFDLEMTIGDRDSVLTKAGQVVITEACALKYFGKENPIGKTIGADANSYTVSGVCKNLPGNSHLQFDLVCSKEGFPNFGTADYTSFSSHVYVELKPGASAKDLEAKFPQMVDTYAAPHIERDLGKSWADYKKAGYGYRYFLQPLTAIHLDPTNLEYTITTSGNRDYVYILFFISLLILAIACINFMNLATARSAERAREVGVRKALGSDKRQLVQQFLTEAVLVSFIATAVALLLAQLMLPAFNQLAAKQLTLFLNLKNIFTLIGFAFLVGILTGLYPAFVLSSFNPVLVMKGNFTGSSKGAWMRNGLVVFQFMVSIMLMVGTLVVTQQMNFMQSKKLGFDKDQVVMVERLFSMRENTNPYIDQIKQNASVINAAKTSAILGKSNTFFGEQFQVEGSSEILTVKYMAADDQFAKTIGFEMKEGHFFSEETIDSLSIIINEKAAKLLGLGNPIGRRLTTHDQNQDGTFTNHTFNIIGVVSDFHFQSLRDEITPLVIYSMEFFRFQPFLAVKIKGINLQATIAQLENKWKELAPGKPFRYSFLDEQLKNVYAEEKRAGDLFSVFSTLAIIIACVGLFGLSAYTANLRTKEIGVRKIMGASVVGVTILLSKGFTKLVVIAFVLAMPLSWWAMNNWLQNFAYRIALGPLPFVLAGVASVSIAWITVSYQSIRAALVNPVNSLRNM